MDSTTLVRWGLNFFELLACVTGFIYWNKLKNTYWKWFPVYLAVILLVELSGKYILNVLGNIELNIRLYRFFGTPLQFLFFFWLFNRYFRHDKERTWPVVGAAIYIISSVMDIYYLGGKQYWFFSFSYTVGNVILVILIMVFFIKLVKSEAILEYKSNMMFWVCLGLLLFYLGTLPFYGLRNLLFTGYKKVFITYWYIQFALGYLMYISFTLGFICSKRS